MTTVRVLRGIPGEIEEDQLQSAIESDLGVLEEGLEYVESEVVIGTGRIDTLAVDQDNRPTLVEYKRPGDFGKDALVQLMDYLAWFVKDPNRFGILEKHVRAKRSDIERLEPPIRLMLVVSDVDDRVINACYVIENPIKIFTYSLAKLENGDTVVLPREVLDNEDVERPVPKPARPEEEIVKEPYKKSYGELRACLAGLPGVEIWTLSNKIRAASGRAFITIRFRKNWMTLHLRVGNNKVKHPRFEYDRQGDSSWGKIRIKPLDPFSEDIKQLVRQAYEYNLDKTAEEENDGP